MNRFTPYPTSVRYQIRRAGTAYVVFDTASQAVAFYNGTRASFPTYSEARAAKSALSKEV